jgi:hypothetical protein
MVNFHSAGSYIWIEKGYLSLVGDRDVCGLAMVTPFGKFHDNAVFNSEDNLYVHVLTGSLATVYLYFDIVKSQITNVTEEEAALILLGN